MIYTSNINNFFFTALVLQQSHKPRNTGAMAHDMNQPIKRLKSKQTGVRKRNTTHKHTHKVIAFSSEVN